MGIFSTGGMAKTAIAEGLVTVDGNVEKRKRCKIKRGQIVEYDGRAVTVTGNAKDGQGA
jgi:ribosome-associated protein